MSMTMNEIYEEILKDGGMTPSKKIKDTSIRFPNKVMNLIREKEDWLLVESDSVKGWVKKDDTWGLN